MAFLNHKRPLREVYEGLKILKIPKSEADQQFPLGKVAFSLLQLSPESTGRRKTLIKNIVPNKIWTLDQIQGIINVNGTCIAFYASFLMQLMLLSALFSSCKMHNYQFAVRRTVCA
jgi:hypothetical protein